MLISAIAHNTPPLFQAAQNATTVNTRSSVAPCTAQRHTPASPECHPGVKRTGTSHRDFVLKGPVLAKGQLQLFIQQVYRYMKCYFGHVKYPFRNIHLPTPAHTAPRTSAHQPPPCAQGLPPTLLQPVHPCYNPLKAVHPCYSSLKAACPPQFLCVINREALQKYQPKVEPTPAA